MEVAKTGRSRKTSTPSISKSQNSRTRSGKTITNTVNKTVNQGTITNHPPNNGTIGKANVPKESTKPPPPATTLRRSSRLNSTGSFLEVHFQDSYLFFFLFAVDITNHVGELKPPGNNNSGIKLTIRVNQTNSNCDMETLPDKNNNVDTLPPSVDVNRVPTDTKYSTIDHSINHEATVVEDSSMLIDHSESSVINSSVNGSQNSESNQESIASSSTVDPNAKSAAHYKYKKKKKKKKSKHRLNATIEKKLCQAKRLRLIFGNDSISIDIKNKLKL